MNNLAHLYNLCVKIQNNIMQNFSVSNETLKVSNETLKIVQQIKPNDSSNVNNDLNTHDTILTEVANIKSILANTHNISNTDMLENTMFNKAIDMSVEEKLAFAKTPVFAKMQQDQFDLLNYYYNNYLTSGGNTNDLDMLERRMAIVNAYHNYGAMNQCLRTKYIDDLTKDTASSIVKVVADIY